MGEITNDQIMFNTLDLIQGMLDAIKPSIKTKESERLLGQASENVRKVIQADYPSLIREKAEAQARVKAEKDASIGETKY